MIPRDYITAWRAQAPWVQDIQVEQDLVICRALVAIFSSPVLAEALAFRGGTALYKLYLKPAARYSEDIDLVQMRAEPAGPVMDALRAVLGTAARDAGLAFVAPPLRYCTDNAAMIAWAGLERLALGQRDGLDFAPRPRWPLAEPAPEAAA